jgi:tight adherence protein B
MTTLVAMLAGAGFGLGVLLVADGLRRRPRPPATAMSLLPRLRTLVGMFPKVTAAVAVGLVVAVATGWPVGGILAGLAAATLPSILGPDREHQRQLARVEALASWAELLRDTLKAAAGLQQAIVATAATAPQPIAAEVSALAAGLQNGQRLPDALRQFADELADPTGDTIVASLLIAADTPSAHLADLLGQLAATARERAAMRTRVAISHARIRTSARVIAGTTVVMVVGLVLLNRQWMDPYDTPLGQLVMLAVGALFAAGFAGLKRMSHIPNPPRILQEQP